MTASVILHFHRMGHVYAEKGKGDWGCQYPIFCIRWVNNDVWVNYIPFNLSLQNLNVLFPVRILQVAGFVADVWEWGQARGLCTFRDQKKITPLPLNRLKCKLLYEGFGVPIEITATRESQGRQGDIWTLLQVLYQLLKNINALPNTCSPRMRYETAVLNKILSISVFTVYRELIINYYKLWLYTL